MTVRPRDLVPLGAAAFAGEGCPACGAPDQALQGTVWPGIHVLAQLHCPACGLEYLRDFPVGFAVDHPMALRRSDGRLYNLKNGPAWIHHPLVAAYRRPDTRAVRIERIVHREARHVVVLNTLDFLYGHVLLKLYNAEHYLNHHPGMGLVVIVPRMFQWLVPDGTAEVWSVDLRLGESHGWYPAIDAFVQQQLPRYAEVWLGMGYAHPEFHRMDIRRFTRVEPFPLERYSIEPARITFVLRRDRLWLRSPLAKLVYRALRKLAPAFATSLFVRDQDRLVCRTMRLIRRQLPDVRFSVVGLGRAGGMPAGTDDLRTEHMDEAMERRWCEAYARSQLVVGVHGSNMLLPTAHAAGCIEILPYDRYGNIVQDISVRHHDRMQLFLYRFVDEFARPRDLARHALSMFRDYEVYHRDNRVNIFTDA